MQDRLQLLAEHWVSYKIWLIETVGLTNDAMHIHGALLILCVSALVLRRRPDSPWYPTMRLFRQKNIGAWAAVLDEVAAALRDFRTP